jgi:hypothetical protein
LLLGITAAVGTPDPKRPMIALDTFIRRIRDRFAATGATAVLSGRAEQPAPTIAPGVRRWAADPVHSDDSIRENTGHTWDEWVDLIDAGPGRQAGHTAIAAWVHAAHGVPGWWAQGVTVGFERITGLRLPGQMPDGTFSVSRSRIVEVPVELLRGALLDEPGRADLFPGLDTELRSKPAAQALRFAVSRAGQPVGSLLISADARPDGRVRVTVTHDKLTSTDEGAHWKQFWADWLAAVAHAAETAPRPSGVV